MIAKTTQVSQKPQEFRYELLVDRGRILIENVEISRKIKIKQTFVFQALFIGTLVDDRENNAGKPKTARVSLRTSC